MADIKRQVAIKVWISELKGGSYIQEGGMNPNYVLTKENKKISRVNLLGVVVSVGDDANMKSFVLDDGSASITVRSFEENKALKADLGDVLVVVGRPREYGNEIYVLPEIVKKVDNSKWIEFRKIELGKREEIQVVEQVVEEKGQHSEVYELIKSLDVGTGVLVDDVIEKISDAEKAIDGLLSRGEIFEVSPGRIKVID